MEFQFTEVFTSPLLLLLIASGAGVAAGRINLGRFNLGASAALFTGLAIGYAAYRYSQNVVARGEGTAGYAAASALLENSVISMDFFNLFLILFMTAVSLLAAKDIGTVFRRYGVKFVILGLVISLSGAAATFGLTFVGKSDVFSVAGVYTGALTSSPGLAVALETAGDQAGRYADQYVDFTKEGKEEVLAVIDPKKNLTAENTPTLSPVQKKTLSANAEANVAIGHIIGYPFGVIIVIFAMNFFPLMFRIDVEEEKRRYAAEMKRDEPECLKIGKKEPFDLFSFSLVCILGYVFGELGVRLGILGAFRLGATGGALILGLALGYAGKVGGLRFRMDEKALALVRDITLVFFLATVGLRYGFKTVDALTSSGLYLAVISLVIGIFAMLPGFFLGRYVFKLNWIILSGAICGGMTSTPGLGSAIDALKSDEPAAGYGATYPFALFFMVICTVLLHNLPVG